MRNDHRCKMQQQQHNKNNKNTHTNICESHKNQGQYFVAKIVTLIESPFTQTNAHTKKKPKRISVNYPRNIIAIFTFLLHRTK